MDILTNDFSIEDIQKNNQDVSINYQISRNIKIK